MEIDKTYRTEFARRFLLEHLPEPLTRASFHWQIFDNYIEHTRLRLRSVRNPETKEWERALQRRFPAAEADLAAWKVTEMPLDESEYHIFEPLEGREIRKNRYFFEDENRMIEIDVFLGKLWGLNLARVEFESAAGLKDYTAPSFVVAEVTNNAFFSGEELVDKSFEDVQREFAKMVAGQEATRA